MFQPLILIYRKDNFMYHHWDCTSIYWPLSYPFRSLQITTYDLKCRGFLWDKTMDDRKCTSPLLLFMLRLLFEKFGHCFLLNQTTRFNKLWVPVQSNFPFSSWNNWNIGGKSVIYFPLSSPSVKQFHEVKYQNLIIYTVA